MNDPTVIIDTLRCSATGCVGFATRRSANGGWVCAIHHEVHPAAWPLATGWLRQHVWWLRLIARAPLMPEHEWAAGRWQEAAAFVERHCRDDLAPQSGERDERRHMRLWTNRLQHMLITEAIAACAPPRRVQPVPQHDPEPEEVRHETTA
jgi:hypothetical protein